MTPPVPSSMDPIHRLRETLLASGPAARLFLADVESLGDGVTHEITAEGGGGGDGLLCAFRESVPMHVRRDLFQRHVLANAQDSFPLKALSSGIVRLLGSVMPPHQAIGIALRPDGLRFKWYFEMTKAEGQIVDGHLRHLRGDEVARDNAAALAELVTASVGGESFSGEVSRFTDLGWRPDMIGVNVDPGGRIEAKLYLRPGDERPLEGCIDDVLSVVSQGGREAARSVIEANARRGYPPALLSFALAGGEIRVRLSLEFTPTPTVPADAAPDPSTLGTAAGFVCGMRDAGWPCMSATYEFSQAGVSRAKTYFLRAGTIRTVFESGAIPIRGG